jgi:hypothetical protein
MNCGLSRTRLTMHFSIVGADLCVPGGYAKTESGADT